MRLSHPYVASRDGRGRVAASVFVCVLSVGRLGFCSHSPSMGHSSFVGHEFVDVVGYQWSPHGMVLHIGNTTEHGGFVTDILHPHNW